MNQPDPTTRFSDRVASYVGYRPGYPDAAIDWLLGTAGLPAPGVVADIGSGTGIFTRALLARGHRVFAVEPNTPMRQAAELALGEHDGFVSTAGTAEATTLADHHVDLVTAAQALHWFDLDRAKREFARILRPGGRVALIWNDRDTAGTTFARDYEALIRGHATDYERVNHQNLADADFDRFFTGRWTQAVFTNEQALDRDGLVGRLLSSSYMPTRDSPAFPAMLEAVDQLMDNHAAQGRVVIGYQTKVYLGGV